MAVPEKIPLPEDYAAQMRRLLGEEGFSRYLAALDCAPERALRVNLLRRPDGAPPCPIEGLGGAVPWERGAYFLEGDARPGLSPLHEGGLYYLQEPSALAAVPALDPRPGERVLDLCAAPGGKATQIAARMAGRGLLVANEPVPSRAQTLSRSVERMGVRNAAVTCETPERLAPRFLGFFDRALVDAPCSGEGMFRRQPEARGEWTAASPEGCAGRQRAILAEAARMLRPGGTLVYSTCTFNDVENEGVLRAFLAEHPDFSLSPFALPGLPEAREGFMHLYPHEMRGEGHFVARLRRSGEPEASRDSNDARNAGGRGRARGRRETRETREIREIREKNPPPLPDALAPDVRLPRLQMAGGCVWSLPEGFEPERFEGLRALRTGLLAFRAQGRVLVPDHALAMALTPAEAARTANLTLEQAARYQAGEALPDGGGSDDGGPGDGGPGFALAVCCGVPLGWCKRADGLLKNHYPKGLRRPLA